MAVVVVEALLSSFFEVVLDKVVIRPLLDYAERLKVDKTALQKWRTTLLQMQDGSLEGCLVLLVKNSFSKRTRFAYQNSCMERIWEYKKWA